LGWEFPRKKNNPAEDGIDETNGLFQQNFGFSAEQKTLGIRIRTIPRKRKQLEIPFRGTKVEANFFILKLNHAQFNFLAGFLYKC
jgi:hypothetical protein